MLGVLARVWYFLRGTVHCIAELSSDGVELLVGMVRSRAALSAEILFLGSSWLSIRNTGSNPIGSPTRPELGWSFVLGGLHHEYGWRNWQLEFRSSFCVRWGIFREMFDRFRERVAASERRTPF